MKYFILLLVLSTQLYCQDGTNWIGTTDSLMTINTSSCFSIDNTGHAVDAPCGPTQQVCLYGPGVLRNPLYPISKASVVMGANGAICMTIPGTKHWFQEWPMGVAVANEFGEMYWMVRWNIDFGSDVSMSLIQR